MLDFGTGTAALSLLAKQLSPRSEIIGIDVDQKIIGIAREKIKALKAEISIDRYDGSTLPYPDGHFDKVMSSLVFHHLTRGQKDRSLKEIRRVLNSAGELHVADWGQARTIANRLRSFPFSCWMDLSRLPTM